MPVAVIGMHRSGTSMVARMLNICGLDLGAVADMVPAQDTNPTGHWEHARLVDLNKRILAQFGGTAEDPPALPPDWLDAPALEPLRAEAVAYIAATFGAATSWGWKDPRTTLTVPFWRQVAPGLRFVVCVRNPLDVAASMAARNHITMRQAMALWQHYTEAALRHTRPEERVVTFYEDYFPHYRQALAPVLDFLGLPPVVEGSAEDKALRAFVDSGLKHHSHTLDDVIQSPETFIVTRLLYEGVLRRPDTTQALLASPAFEEHTLRAWGGSQQEVVQAQAEQISRWAKDYADLQRWTDQQAATIEDLSARPDQSAEEYEKLHAWADQQAATIQHQAATIEGQAARIAQQAEEYEKLHAWADTQAATIQEQAAQHETSHAWAETQAATIQGQAARIAQLEQDLAKLTEWTNKQAETIRRLNTRIDQLAKESQGPAPSWERRP